MTVLSKTLKELALQRDSARDKLCKGAFHDFTGAMVLVERGKAFGEAIEIVRSNDQYEEDIDDV